jgi:hypothetical protein
MPIASASSAFAGLRSSLPPVITTGVSDVCNPNRFSSSATSSSWSFSRSSHV